MISVLKFDELKKTISDMVLTVSFQPKVDMGDLQLRRGFVDLAYRNKFSMIANGNRSPESVVREIRRKTRPKYSTEEKIRITESLQVDLD